ncbi:MAG: His-Xaa-Ser system protein HxsD [Bacteroidaceae bacterium]|nr:His-Xaa-Ser system protein HxsD [Bacteroidaceae bacterium]
MHSFTIENTKHASFYIDKSIYSENVLTKVLYLFSNAFNIRLKTLEQKYFVEFISLTNVDWDKIEHEISQSFIDYKMREIIEQETHDLRKILYIKAFSNLDDFDEYVDK